ncbi:MAG: aldose 1-epimerase family protein [Salegentibacter sp.]
MKTFSIQNQHLSVSVLKTGAELCSIKNLENNKEYIWQANPDIWSSHAPNLFPVIGMLKDGKYCYEGTEYEMPKHGFVRHNNNIDLKHRDENSLRFILAHSEETLELYPFKFYFEITFSLEGKSLKVSHKISNIDEKPMYFSLGGHPAFNAPLFEDETYDDYFLEFDQNMQLDTHLLNEDGLVSKKTETILDNDNKIRLRKDLFENDALIFKDIPSKKADLKSAKSGKILSVEYNDFKNLGLWAKPGAPYVCIEPWLGIADPEDTDQELKTKEGIIELRAREDFTASYTISNV